MTKVTAICGARIFDGYDWHDDKALVLEGELVRAIVALADIPKTAMRVDYDGMLVVPGFVDLQVNGGGGAQFGDVTSVDAIRRITSAHAKFGTTKLLPTLITDTREMTDAALEAGRAARAEKVAGFLGVHLEGPHLSLARKGAHDPALIRPMEAADVARMLAYRADAGLLMTTLAPESVTAEQVSDLASKGVLISIGHTDISAETAFSYFSAGARMVTHLFNAMSPLTHREPGLVGAALHDGRVSAGLIADGFHIDPVAMGVALRAKRGPGKIFLVTDAMSTIGTDLPGLVLNGRQIFREGGRLTLADGTLAGADIDMLSCIRFVHEVLGLSLEESLRMASLYPAEAVQMDDRLGRLQDGFVADFVVLDPKLSMFATWIDGNLV